MLIILGHLLSMVPSEVQSRELPPLLPLLFEGIYHFIKVRNVGPYFSTRDCQRRISEFIIADIDAAELIKI